MTRANLLTPWDARPTEWGEWAKGEFSLKDLTREVRVMGAEDWTVQVSGKDGDLMVNIRGDYEDVKLTFVDNMGVDEESFVGILKSPFADLIKKPKKIKKKHDDDEDESSNDDDDEEEDDEPLRASLSKAKKLGIKGYKDMDADELKKAINKKVKSSKKKSKEDD